MKRKEKQCTVCSLLNSVVLLNYEAMCMNEFLCKSSVLCEHSNHLLIILTIRSDFQWLKRNVMAYPTSLVTASLALVLSAFCCFLKFCNPRAQYTAKSSRRSSSARLKTSVSARATFLLLTSWHTPIRRKQYVCCLNRLFSYQYHC